jgi:hypothetical protein
MAGDESKNNEEHSKNSKNNELSGSGWGRKKSWRRDF